MNSVITTRPASAEDLNLILHSWLMSFRVSPFAKSVPNSVYFAEHQKLIKNILNRAQVICAVNEEDESQIYGWICAELDIPVPVIHYIYVKQPYRRFGIGRSLFKLVTDSGFVYTHETGITDKFSRKGIYSPYHMYGIDLRCERGTL